MAETKLGPIPGARLPRELLNSPFTAEVENFDTCRERAQGARRALDALTKRRREAESADADALADALAAGKKDPGASHVPALEAEIADAHRVALALHRNAARAWDDLMSAMTADRLAEWQDQLRAEADQAKEQILAALATLPDHVLAIDKITSRLEWSRSVAAHTVHKTRGFPSGMPIREAIIEGGRLHSTPVNVVLNALAAWATQPPTTAGEEAA
ncbi:hypothetical protein [Actinospongicola halichondriae]|uniref:hypothetical protein n=1 Tax=Actinospongicola halichondriae TaxID=3236844 RepID=UPI003D4E49F2